MSSTSIAPSTFEFLRDLAAHNDREWFEANKPRYRKEHEKMLAFADELLHEMQGHDNIETPSAKKVLHRIYRDIRFSKDKRPYKNNFSGSFKRATRQLRGGYYFHIEPGNVFVGGGFWGPSRDDLKLIRDDIAADASELREIINDPLFIETFGELKGNGVKTAPRGYDKEHPDIDLIRKKQYIVMRSFTDKQAASDDFVYKVSETFERMRPFFDYMSYVLTTDANGVPLYPD